MKNWSRISWPSGSLNWTGAANQQRSEQHDCERTHGSHGGAGLSRTVAASTIEMSNIPSNPITICQAGFWMNGTATSRMHMAKMIPKSCRSNCRVRACLETTRGAVFGEKAGWQARRRRISLVDLRLRSNEARRPFPRKPSGRRVFCPWPALARSLQPAAGRCARPRPPWPQPKSLAAAPLVVSKQALSPSRRGR